MEEWISLNEYCSRYKMAPEQAKKMISEKQIDYFKTDKGYYKIKVGGDTVSKTIYEEEKKRRIEAENTIDLLKRILIKG